ncbi:MAG: 2-oxoglutarate dehydrogenase complex dihydrolipoyllysine-residue succinyltransferase [Alphaproteobacteria bacterium]|nr:2-oxoglutarate dehydrogenase complex dihydrolipoyllysine-residue succinyltransferase [Alphaproteobacteria bacterium]
MSAEIRVPALGESITEATVAQWHKQTGDSVNVDEPLCELETDKVTIDVPAPMGGIMGEILVEAGAIVEVGALLGAIIEAGDETPKTTPAPKTIEQTTKQEETNQASAPSQADETGQAASDILAPSVRKLISEHGLDPAHIAGTGKQGRLTKTDIMKAIADVPQTQTPSAPQATAASTQASNKQASGGREERVRMTRLRQTIAKRLKDSQNTAAILTTFNEVDMSALMAVRNEYKAQFETRYGVKLGFMSFFVKACVMALQEIPTVNAEIDGDELVYRHYVNMGVAVGTDKGLVVPVLKNAQDMGFAEIECVIADYAEKAHSGELKIEDLQGGTFTISNGGVYGSLMSTPILNTPQSGILGMHKITDRPVVINGEITIRPIMYLALSYDHRIVDGREAVMFLMRVKEGIETPERLLLDV